ncbi:MAG: pentapeptide repeat-containing protein [Planctomycetota bacterium]|nr:MAG: pentapeptide repeat-containing protein [Planctomycetota bacterium]
MAIEEQFLVLWRSSDWSRKNQNQEWNQWREKYGDGEIDLSGANLLGRDLSGANLEKANLQNAVLSGVSLKEANLREADLSNSHLQGADFTGADLKDALFQGASLRDAILKDCKNLNPEQLSEAKELDGITGLEDDFIEKLAEIAPHLMEWKK